MIASRRVGAALGVMCVAAVASETSSAAPLQQNGLAPIQQNGEEWLRVRANGYVRAKKSVEQVRKSLMHLYKRSDTDGAGISNSDYLLREQKESAGQRSRHINTWLNRDLDGDGIVTRAELERLFIGRARRKIYAHGTRLQPSEAQISKSLSNLVGRALKADADSDGSVSFSEILSYAKSEGRRRRQPWWASYLIPLSLDRDGDQIVTEEEYANSVSTVLRKIDIDGSGRFSSGEIAALRSEVKHLRKILRKENNALRRTKKVAGSRRKKKVSRANRKKKVTGAGRKQKVSGASRKQKVAATTGACQFPAVPSDAKIILLGTHEGDALSTTSLGDEGHVVSVANLWIEPGQQPLYIVVASGSPMIWQVSGYVDRVTALVANAFAPSKMKASPAGVVGLAKDRVHVTANYDCIDHFAQSQSPRAERAVQKLQDIVGRSADSILGSQNMSAVSLPSGIFDSRAVYGNAVNVRINGRGGPLWRQLIEHRPGGLVRIEPYSIVSRLRATSYKVLPRQAGLARLLEDGALAMIGSQEIVAMDGTPIRRASGLGVTRPDQTGQSGDIDAPREFRILKKIHYPAGLSGRHAVWFLLAPGVEKPDGDPGQSCLIDQKTGDVIVAGRYCRNDPV